MSKSGTITVWQRKVTALAAIDAWKVFKRKKCNWRNILFLLVLTQAKLLYTLWLSRSLMGQILVSASPFRWKMLMGHSVEGLEVFLKMLLAGIWEVGCTERKGAGTQSAEQRAFCRAETGGTGCAVTHPPALALQLWLTAGLCHS